MSVYIKAKLLKHFLWSGEERNQGYDEISLKQLILSKLQDLIIM